tara:strand:+ start:1331 stop:1465 length:135 start_codon:yes stop_codon:yes gene_type:complete
MDLDGIIMSKELAFVYIVNGKKFLNKEDAVNYMNEEKKKISQGD